MRLTKTQNNTIKQLPNLTELSDRDLEIVVGGARTWPDSNNGSNSPGGVKSW
ncbi:hypothetical protein H6G41_18070 [Tolypothrix sp. FACHB-123]|uniref:hypothetical protein n=1 Tax=Tolypothrix sp. FACHB-123 TaxID=2692868 RepID=UPI0016832AD1|nr:hypothetical protein [Tolypothrix sp. FACHB-123]MBD2356509.1 hypothetical protein [Tolypothrix sp. FACHB-123]